MAKKCYKKEYKEYLIILSPTEPKNAAEGTIWVDTSEFDNATQQEYKALGAVSAAMLKQELKHEYGASKP